MWCVDDRTITKPSIRLQCSMSRRRSPSLTHQPAERLQLEEQCGGHGMAFYTERPWPFVASHQGRRRMAEQEGFEPSVVLPLRSLSKGVLSTTQPLFLEAGRGL